MICESAIIFKKLVKAMARENSITKNIIENIIS